MDLNPFIEPEPTPTFLEPEGVPAAPAPNAPPASTLASTEQPTGGSGARRRIGRTAATLLLAAGLFAVGGASVVMAATPSPSASTTPSTQQGSVPYANGNVPYGGAGGGMPGGCTHAGTSGSSG